MFAKEGKKLSGFGWCAKDREELVNSKYLRQKA